MIERTISGQVVKTLLNYDKIAMVSGPRQVGKTTLAKKVGGRQFTQRLYFNWDVINDQKRLTRDPYFFEKADRDPALPFLVILDEVHKFARWKNYLKGAYDRFNEDFRFLVTGSGRLDLYKKGGDSLFGRYFDVPLLPFSVGEIAGELPGFDDFMAHLANPPPAHAASREAYEALYGLSGFPEPFVRGRKDFYNLWFQERKDVLIRQEIRDATRIREISLVGILSHLIPERVGSPLSINSMREDVGVAFETVRDWISVLEQFYYMFRLTPLSSSLKRTLRKTSKPYLYDWVEVPKEGPRFENLVAFHMYKAVRTWRALGAGDVGLHFVRDKEGREVDFVLTKRGEPICLVECKLSDTEPDKSLRYFQERLNVPVAVQLVHQSGVSRRMRSSGGRDLWVISADHWLALLP